MHPIQFANNSRKLCPGTAQSFPQMVYSIQAQKKKKNSLQNKKCYLILHKNINSKRIRDLNVRLENVQHLEENTVCKFLDIGLNNDFLDMTPKPKANKRKNKQFIKLKMLCTVKETTDKMKSLIY